MSTYTQTTYTEIIVDYCRWALLYVFLFFSICYLRILMEKKIFRKIVNSGEKFGTYLKIQVKPIII